MRSGSRCHNRPRGDLDQFIVRPLKAISGLANFEPVSPQPWSDCMQKLTTALCVALFALSGAASHAADPKPAEPAKQATAKPADKAASAAPAQASAPAPAAKKEKKGGC
jgi:hypothetical protein